MADGWDLFGGPPTAAAPVATQTAPAPAGSSDGWAAFGGHPSEDVPPPAAAPEPQSAQSRMDQRIQRMTLSPTEAEAFSAGMGRGFRDVVDRPAQWLAQGADALGLTQGQGAAVQAGNTADRQAYEAQYGTNGAGEMGRLVEQGGLTAPLVSGVGNALFEGGNLAAAGVGRLAPMAGRVVQGVTDFLGGTAGGAGGFIPRVTQGASVVANSAAQGAGAAAATAGQSDQPLLPQMEQGAIAGAVMGPAVRGTNALLDTAGNTFSSQTSAQKDIVRAIQRDNLTPADIQQKANDLATVRPNATIADAGGENVRGLVERVAQTPGAGRTVVVPALTESQQQQMGRIADDLRGMTGTSKTAIEAMNDAMTTRSTAAQPLYAGAMQFNPTADPALTQAWQDATSNGWGKAALSSATLRRNLASEHGITDLSGPPTMATIDGWKKAMDDLASSQSRSGNNNSARVISNVRDNVIQAVDAANPQYAQARNAWAGPSAYMDALEAGKGIASPSLTAEELSNRLAGMTDAEREAFRTGAVTSLVGKMGNDPAKLADMTKYLRSPEMRSKVSALMPDAAAEANWNKALDYEVNSSALTGKALGGSPTARRLAEADDGESVAGDLIREGLGMAITGGLGGSKIWKAAISGVRMARDAARSRSDAIVGKQLVDPLMRNGLFDFLNPPSAASQPGVTTFGGLAPNAILQIPAPFAAIGQGQLGQNRNGPRANQ